MRYAGGVSVCFLGCSRPADNLVAFVRLAWAPEAIFHPGERWLMRRRVDFAGVRLKSEGVCLPDGEARLRAMVGWQGLSNFFFARRRQVQIWISQNSDGADRRKGPMSERCST